MTFRAEHLESNKITLVDRERAVRNIGEANVRGLESGEIVCLRVKASMLMWSKEA